MKSSEEFIAGWYGEMEIWTKGLPWLIQYVNQLAYRFLSALIIGELSLSPPQAAPGLAS